MPSAEMTAPTMRPLSNAGRDRSGESVVSYAICSKGSEKFRILGI